MITSFSVGVGVLDFVSGKDLALIFDFCEL